MDRACYVARVRLAIRSSEANQMTPRVVAALQSPTLLNILIQSSAWSLSVQELGDHAELKETSLADFPILRRPEERVELVLVCSPDHLFNARKIWPRAKIAWLIHNGRQRSLLPPEHEDKIDCMLCFSDRVRWLAESGRQKPAFFVSPYYEAKQSWSWSPGILWNLRNRPETRSDDADGILPAITSGLNLRQYGQEQELGLATPQIKQRLIASCSAYMSYLHRSAGFGLAEHECLAAGVPVIGDWWGDMEDELPAEYWGLRHNLKAMRDSAVRVCEDESGARELSSLGLEYIRRYRTKDRMDDSIAEMLSRIGL